MTTDERAELRLAAMETREPWWGGDVICIPAHGNHLAGRHLIRVEHRTDAAYIAAANPSAVTALLDALDAAEARAALAERQVRVLAALVCGRNFPCPELCPAYQRDVCYRYETSGPHCVENWLATSAAWSAREAGGA